MMPSSSSSNSSNFNHHTWIIHVRKTLDQDSDDDHDLHDFPVTIFNVPKILMATDPDSYVPHHIAIGPYHHFRPDLYEMERYKLDATRRTQKTIQPLKIHHVVDHFLKFESRIRSCYHKFLDFSGETLAWMMAVDVCFLLEFLRVYAADKEGNLRPRTHNSILRDVIMLENQIPLFLMRKVLEFCGQTRESADQSLLAMIMGMSEELSPLKLIGEHPHDHVLVQESAHLVGFLYNLLVPKSIDDTTTTAETLVDSITVRKETGGEWSTKCGRIVKTIMSSKSVRLAVKLPLSVILNHPIIGVFKQPLEHYILSSKETGTNKPPLLEEISIPSVSELILAGVNFAPSKNNNIMTINFDESTSTFYLPTVILEANTKLVLRNLVAYEACAISGPLVFTRYTEMMNGIIDTKEDARLLRERGIIVNHLNSDKEAADMWNGMNKSIRLTNVRFLDQLIGNVNKFYRSSWKIKMRKFVNFYIFQSWQFLLLLLVSMFLLLMSLQIVAIIINFSVPNHKV